MSGITGRAVSLSVSPGAVGTCPPGPRRPELLAQLRQTTLNRFPKPQLHEGPDLHFLPGTGPPDSVKTQWYLIMMLVPRVLITGEGD